MAANIFLRFYNKKLEEKSDTISLNDIKTEILKQKVPLKELKVEYDADFRDIIKKSRDTIISNLCLNEKLNKDSNFRIEYLKNLVELINTAETTDSEDVLVRCLLMMFNSKTQTDLSYVINLIQYLPSINIIRRFEFFLNEELDLFFTRVVSSSKFQEIVLTLVKQILAFDDLEFDFDIIELNFIDCDIENFKGFSGQNQLYLNVKPIKTIWWDPKYEKFSSKQKILVIKLEFFALILHEIALLVLRSTVNDLNFSTKILNKILNESKENIISKVDSESVEKVFKNNTKFNHELVFSIKDFDYCESYLQNFINNKDSIFDFSKAGLV